MELHSRIVVNHVNMDLLSDVIGSLAHLLEHGHCQSCKSHYAVMYTLMLQAVPMVSIPDRVKELAEKNLDKYMMQFGLENYSGPMPLTEVPQEAFEKLFNIWKTNKDKKELETTKV